MPVMECSSGQFFDDIRSQCISCANICSPSKAWDNLCRVNCPLMPKTEEVIGPIDVPTSFNINILFATVVPITAVLVIICISIWMMWRRDRRAKNNVGQSEDIEMQPVDQLLPPCSIEEQESPKDIPIGGFPETNADHTETQFLPSGVH